MDWVKNISTGKKVVATEKPQSDVIIDLSILGAIIKHKRTSLNLSSKKAAALCKIGDKTLRNIEDGKETKLSTVLKVIKMLGLRMTLGDK